MRQSRQSVLFPAIQHHLHVGRAFANRGGGWGSGRRIFVQIAPTPPLAFAVAIAFPQTRASRGRLSTMNFVSRMFDAIHPAVVRDCLLNR